jgi:hypothetical protein
LEKIDDDAQSDQRHFFSSIAKVRGTKVDSSIDTLYTTPISEANPTLVTTSDPEQIKEVLRSSFQNQARAHNPGDSKFDSAFFTTVCHEVGAVSPEAVGPQVLEEPLTLKEVEEAIGQAQNNKALGQDTMFNELIKYGGEQAAQRCFFLFTQLFEMGSPLVHGAKRSYISSLRGVTRIDCHVHLTIPSLLLVLFPRSMRECF